MKVVLGANHQFLYPQAMTNAQAHTQTLRSMAQIRSLAALDCWLWPERQRSSEEKRILRDSGKWINYNIGDRPMDEPCFPASPDPNRRMRALDLLRREVEFAMEVGARKIVLGSGPDVPADREAAKERLSEVLRG